VRSGRGLLSGISLLRLLVPRAKVAVGSGAVFASDAELVSNSGWTSDRGSASESCLWYGRVGRGYRFAVRALSGIL
jgi:hypothetical protein